MYVHAVRSESANSKSTLSKEEVIAQVNLSSLGDLLRVLTPEYQMQTLMLAGYETTSSKDDVIYASLDLAQTLML